ncbi:high mobility group protein Z [Pantoea ananatis]|uniref:high mobility group protein Z n=1 Tax=uncultured Pantoea sp. TaxID=218084 RepID=UPI000D73BD55|nr:high mobility group protein Z [Pantoea ananatis]AWQ20677.1 high mobility group protein Z [Pantoea ananatis]MCK0555714.1 high mobility group protein Z [Pantoea ananatis]MCW1776659.1 high mobility group protein Z [Pantoea ananatis]MDS7718753.1 high mobility group protein Z [Pantoea ananatis]PZD58749.1 high mobility group protein Z [Pantoea ananatis]
MFWPGSIFALLMTCYLLWLLFKLRRLSRLKQRLRRVSARSPLFPSGSRPLRRQRKRKE